MIHGHKIGFRHPKKHGNCCIVSEYFDGRLFNRDTCRIKILEKIEGSGLTTQQAIDRSCTEYSKGRESHVLNIFIVWIKY